MVIRLVDGKKFKFRVMLYSVDKTENLRPGHSISEVLRDSETAPKRPGGWVGSQEI